MRAYKILSGALAAALGLMPGTVANAAGGGGDAPPLLPMAEIAVPIIDAGRVDGVLRFTLVIQAHDAAAIKALAGREAHMRAAVVASGLEFARLRASPWRPVDVARLSADLDAALHALDPGIEHALIVRVVASTG